VAGSTTVAESTDTVRLEGNQYFPPDTVDWAHLERSPRTSVCPWKGVATYYDVIDGDSEFPTRFPAAAWVYENPSDAAGHIKGYVAFWRGVEVAPSGD
jgi:uncharacterized protein (DUF427 family)